MTQRFCNWYELPRFQLTRSRGAWRTGVDFNGIYGNFNSHAHVERDYAKVGNHLACYHFNSHAHVERDRLKVATLQLMKGISTHTLTWSVTADPKSNSRSYGYFNSHAHVERDHKLIDPHWQLFISTHTLTWSVTSSVVTLQPSTIFQLTRSRGAWPFFLFCL